MNAALPATTALPAWHAALVLLTPIAAALAALAVSSARDPGAAWRAARRGSAAALAAAVASLLALAIGGGGAAFLVRADATGGIVMLLVAFVGWVIVRYSQPYLAGERDERGYALRLLCTLAAVGLVVAANHLLLLALAWTACSLALHRLLTFFDDRPAAMRAAHKKAAVARAADLCMFAALALLGSAFGTLQLDAMLARAAALPGLPAAAHAAMVLVALAALLKCAQLPFHGWLIQVMEAPTPVSALLHAGVVNLGGFVLIRLAPMIAEAPLAQALLVAAGTFTAVVSALVMSTRISVKVALAWSTCAQMGFMLMQCGLGVWEMALLHLVAHSLYKAHAFLSAGGIVRQTAVRQLGPAPTPAGAGTLLAGVVAGVAMTALAALAWGLRPEAQPALWVLGGIVALALTPLAQPMRRSGWGWAACLIGAFAVAFAYFGLHLLFAGWMPPAGGLAAPPLWAGVAFAFLLLFALQGVLAAAPGGRLARRLYPWFYGGLFLDELFGRLLFRLWPPPVPAAPHTALVLRATSGAPR